MLKSIIKILSYSLILLTIVGFQCEKIEPNKRVKLEMSDNFYVFTIKEGAHNSFTGLETFASNHLSFIVKFDSTAIYTNELPENQADINKLYGFTDCNTGVHS